jgi:ribosomal-protein-alanine N-acetyltransferase
MTAPSPPAVDLLILDADALQALVDRDLDRAAAVVGLELPEDFANDTWLWTLRLGQMIGEPEEASWLVRAIVAREGPGAGRIVGHAGFHGRPDARGMVEIGYRIVAAYRRHGYAQAAVAELLAYAAAHGARVARASISPGNERSLRIAARFGFREVGEQMDEIDGRELVFERPL